MDNDLDLRLTLRVQLRHKVNKRRLATHIRDAVENWGGSLHPSDELFDGIKRATIAFPKVSP